jgi:hypothetical protein
MRPNSRLLASPHPISKNSSRLLHEIARNLTRSSSGTLSSCACEHAAVELEEGELAVDEELRRLEVDVVHGRVSGHKT